MSECCICFIEIESGTSIFPCQHDEFCAPCADNINKNSTQCPICRDLTCHLQKIVLLGKEVCEIQVDSNTSCKLMKRMLEPFVGITINEFELIHGGRVITDDKIIKPNKSPIHIVLNLRGD